MNTPKIKKSYIDNNGNVIVETEDGKKYTLPSEEVSNNSKPSNSSGYVGPYGDGVDQYDR